MKKIRRRTRNRIVGVCSTLAVLLLGVVLVTTINFAGNGDFHKELLGDAENYGIVADSIHQTSHMDTNFATNYYTNTSNFTVGQYTFGNPLITIATRVGDPTNPDLPPLGLKKVYGKDFSKVHASTAGGAEAAVFWTAESQDLENLKSKFKIQTKWIEDENGNKVEVLDFFENHAMVQFYDNEDDLKTIVNGMRSHVKGKSEEFGTRLTEGYKWEKDPAKDDRDMIDITPCSEKVVYVDATPLVIKDGNKAMWIKFEEGPKCGTCDYVYPMKDFSVKKRSDQTIVLNFVKTTGSGTLLEEANAVEEPANNLLMGKKPKNAIFVDEDGNVVDNGQDADKTEGEESVAPAKVEEPEVVEMKDEVQKTENQETTPDVEKTADPVVQEVITDGEEETETEETEEKVSFLGLTSVAKAGTKTFGVDMDTTKEVSKVQLHGVKKLYDEHGKDVTPGDSGTDDNSLNAYKTIIYNLPYSTHAWCGYTKGTIIAPNAQVKFGEGNCAGWLVAERVYGNCGEWHFCYNPPKETATPPVETTEPPVETTEPPVETTEPPVETTEPPVETTEPPVVTTEPPVVTTEPPVVTTEPPVVTTEPPVVTTEPPVVTTEPPVVTTEPPVVTTEPPVVTTQPPVTTAPVVTTQPPTNTPPTTYTNPPSNTPPIVYYTFSPAPTETPTTIVEEEVPLSNFTPEEKPKEETTTIIDDVPLAATVPETGDTMNPMIPIAGMGLSLLAMLGVVVIRKKKFTK